MTRWIVLAGVVAIAVFVAPRLHRSVGGESDAAYRTALVERGDISATVTSTGTLNALVMVEVGSQVSGQISELFADFNSPVRRGDVIARIAADSFEAKLGQAQAEVAIAAAAVAMHRAEILKRGAERDDATAAWAATQAEAENARLELENWERDLRRKEALAARGSLAVSDLDQARTVYRTGLAQRDAATARETAARSAVASAAAAVQMAEAQLASSTAQVQQKRHTLRQAEIDLERTFIRAPVDGTVINRNVNRGQTVAASLQAPTLFTIAQDLTRMQVDASVVEADISRFHPDQAVTFTVDAYPGRTFHGAVAQIRRAPQVLQNVVTYTVVIAAPNPDQMLFPGMTATLRATVAEKAGVLKVPAAALRFRPAGRLAEAAAPSDQPAAGAAAPARVFVIGQDGQPRRVAVEAGISDGHMVEIVAGDLAEGEAVVTAIRPPDAAATAGAKGLVAAIAGGQLWR